MNIVKLILNDPQIIIAVILFGVGWYFGTANERKHLIALDDVWGTD